MDAQDQADNLHASSIGPIPSLDDFNPANHAVRERPEDLNKHDLDLQKSQEELSPSNSGRNYLRPVYARRYARRSGSRKKHLRLAYDLKSSKRFLSRAISRRRGGEFSCAARFWDLNSRSWVVGTRSIAENNPDAKAKSFRLAELIQKRGRAPENRARRLGRIGGVPYLVAHYSPSGRYWTGQAYVPWNQPTPDWKSILDTILSTDIPL
ncbi:hypothetical protein CEP54_016258 [Fusarium duplospermum]|uniref:Uncharacterized protein n=1 Tax=Fusarium duplospermum TaxID=1325734 RepID=A0A428NGC3_9HYPO|nr:hypothetical protein CEP54_016258 [Fusarium duplospermum]